MPLGDIEGAMQTPDGQWRVEIVRRRGVWWYRIVHGEDVLDRLSIASVERILREAGVERHTLREVDPSTDHGNGTA
jgi:bifunctional non-homologous end joining protein LigD